SECGNAGDTAPHAEGRSQEPARLGTVAGRPLTALDCPRDREPLLAALFWPGPCENRERLRRSGGVAQPPRATRLPRHRVHGERLGHQADAETDCDEQYVPAVLQS